jgi:hypothetical protein
MLHRMTRAADPRPDKGATRSRITWGTDVTPIQAGDICRLPGLYLAVRRSGTACGRRRAGARGG